MFAKKYEQVDDEGLYWEMIKMEIRAFTIAFAKKKAKRKRDEESVLLSEMIKLQTKLQTSYSDSLKAKLERIKLKLSKIVGIKTRGTIVRSRARWYEHGERNSKYFYNLKKQNQKKKQIMSLVNNDGDKITNTKDNQEEEERYFEKLYASRNMDPNCPIFKEFFEIENLLSEEIAKGVISIEECEIALKTMENNKTPGTDGLTPEFYRFFWNLLGSFMVNSFNYAFRNGTLFISQRQGIISLILKKNTEYLKKMATCIITECRL